VNQIKTWYLALPDGSKQVFLAIVAHQLTVHGRYVAYELSGEQQIRAFTGLNEVQHQITSQIAAIGLASERYPDEVLWAILHEKAEEHQISQQLSESLHFARTRSCWTRNFQQPDR
jgi:hypothetical protein